MESSGKVHVRSVGSSKRQGRDHPTAGAGVSFPQIDGRRSTSASGRAILADAAAAVEPALAERIRSSGARRSDYLAFVRELTLASAGRPGSSLAIARAGLP